ncbi:MAG: type II toxin-antitoxin system RelE/ParE family toxin [Puniceicoccaceae bacterium]|nr:MAG: type II toxin-antitoxin system RelE/ParE family toxin [Puniceicoccaceae bacterium]
MANYKIQIRRSAEKELEKISKKDRKRIIERILALGNDPRPAGVRKLSGEEKYRVRQGNYRILYEINDALITIVVVRVAHRGDVYRH